MSGVPQPDAEPKRWDLAPESEYRFELDPEQSVSIKVRPTAAHDAPPLTQRAARERPGGDLRLRARRGQAVPLRLRVQGGTLHLARLHDRDEYPPRPRAARHAHSRRTSQATPRRTTSPTRRPCVRTRRCTSRSSRCECARCARPAAHPRPTRVGVREQARARTRRACSCSAPSTQERRRCASCSPTTPRGRARAGRRSS